MSITVKLCTNKQDFYDFIEIPYLLHQDDPNWVPPLRATTKRILDKKNPFYKNAEMNLWVAYSNNKPVGRIAGIINRIHNEFYHEPIAFWGFFESINSDEIASALFKQLEDWALNEGVTALRGPMNPSINYECGLQISAFDTNPFIMMPQNPLYYVTLIEKQGYLKCKDLQAWIGHMTDTQIDGKKVQFIKKIQNKYQINIRPINMKNFVEEIKLIATIYNDAWSNNWGYLPLDLEEFIYLASDLKSIILPDYIYIAEIENKPCGFSIAIPDLNQLLIKIRNGKLLPINFLKLLWHIKIKKTITQGRIPLLGVLKKYQHLPIGGILYSEYLKNIKTSKYTRAEFSWILEDNHAMQAGLKLVNATHYKTYRIYEKNLQTTVTI